MTGLMQRWREAVELLATHGPSALVGIAIAETLYKFHSFTLECLAFLATWWIADQVLERPLAVVRAAARRLVSPQP
jgi:hypothetical protein